MMGSIVRAGVRGVRVVSLFWRTAIGAELEYRLNFVFAFLSSLLGLVLGLFALSLFFQNGYTFEGWTYAESLTVYGFFTLLSGYTQSVLSPNLSRIVDHVDKGTLDFILLKPIDTQLWVSTRNFSPWGLCDVVLGAAVIAYGAAGDGVDAQLTGAAVLSSLTATGAAFVLLYSLWFVLASTSIWFVKIYNAAEVLRGLLEAGRFPIAAYPAGYRFFFTFIVPISFLTTVPAEALRGASTPMAVLVTVGLAIAAFVTSRAFFFFALSRYSSASS